MVLTMICTSWELYVQSALLCSYCWKHKIYFSVHGRYCNLLTSKWGSHRPLSICDMLTLKDFMYLLCWLKFFIAEKLLIIMKHNDFLMRKYPEQLNLFFCDHFPEYYKKSICVLKVSQYTFQYLPVSDF